MRDASHLQLQPVDMNIDPTSLARALVEEMKAHGHAMWIDPEIHSSQHEFIAQMIEERKERQERRKRIEEKIAGSLVLSLIVGLVALLGSGLLNWIHKG